MKVAVVDDQQVWREKIVINLMSAYRESEIDTYSSGEEFLDAKEEYPIVFMDVEMGVKNGLETGGEYLERYPSTKVILVTSYVGYAVKGYRKGVSDFVDKTRIEDLKEAYLFAVEMARQLELVSIKTLFGDQEVRIKDILYIEVVGKKRLIRLEKYVLESKESMLSIAENLYEKGFFVPCRSACINLTHVAHFNKAELIMKDGKRIALSREKSKEFNGIYRKWNFFR